MAGRLQLLKGSGMSHTQSLPSIIPKSDARFVIRQEAMTSSSAALNWSGSVTNLNNVRGSRAQSLDDLGDEEDVIISPVGRVTWPLAFTAMAAVFGSSFPHGWNTGVLNAPSHLINGFLNSSFTARSGSPPSPEVLSILWATTVSVYLVGGCAGAFSAGWLADKFGRKKALLLLHVFDFLSAVLFGLCEQANSLTMIIIARLVVGFACGAGSGVVPMYLTEIAPINVRGAMGVLHQFALTCGILVSQIIGLRQLMGNATLWPYLLAGTAVPCVVSMMILPFFPDSPRYLYVTKKDTKAAEKALRTFRGTEDVAMDIKEMAMEVRLQEKDPEWTFRQLISAKALRMPLLLVCALAMCQQLSGINIVFYYSTMIFQASGIPAGYVQYAVLATGTINVIMTAISIPLMEKSGRRPLLLIGMTLMIISAVVITVSLNLQDRFSFLAYFSLICIITFVIGFAIGLGSIPQFIGGELFMQGPRPPAMSLAGFLNWFSNFLVGITFPSIQLAMGAYSFTIFIGILVLFLIFLYKKLPETKNKSYQDIYKIFSKTPEKPPIYKNLLKEDDKRLIRSEGHLEMRRSASAPSESPPLRIKPLPDVELRPLSKTKTPDQQALLAQSAPNGHKVIFE